ncbi:hypothetical protein L6255_04170 [Candidatus Parcubacteria bacterium]|nr:hypothetical protein [Patescibacteria group bacterium]MBU4380688.1 hypothetical protein [Patescibacteria group bacterium]MCG2689605.1 hypothetical protein [Candidatus Parcubacteria bacterium]
MEIPNYIQKYFWEAKLDNPAQKEFYPHLISRVLDLGDTKAVEWLFANFDKNLIVETLINSREISKKSANYWTYYFGIPKDQTKCFQKPLTKQLEKIWPY